MPNSVITGVTGQDGAYLTRQLLARGHTVFGGFRRTSSVNFWRLQELGILDHPASRLVEFDIIDPGACLRLIAKAAPECVYNLAAQSFVGVSFEEPVATAQMTAIGPLHLLEAIRQVNPKIKFYQASSSELYGQVRTTPPAKAERLLGWKAQMRLEELCRLMVEADIRRNEVGFLL